MEVTRTSETSVDFQWTTRRYIPKDRNLDPPSALGIYLWSRDSFLFCRLFYDALYRSVVYLIIYLWFI
jgi:hypothetical protein